jgi:hypothetical protein
MSCHTLNTLKITDYIRLSTSKIEDRPCDTGLKHVETLSRQMYQLDTFYYKACRWTIVTYTHSVIERYRMYQKPSAKDLGGSCGPSCRLE